MFRVYTYTPQVASSSYNCLMRLNRYFHNVRHAKSLPRCLSETVGQWRIAAVGDNHNLGKRARRKKKQRKRKETGHAPRPVPAGPRSNTAQNMRLASLCACIEIGSSLRGIVTAWHGIVCLMFDAGCCPLPEKPNVVCGSRIASPSLRP